MAFRVSSIKRIFQFRLRTFLLMVLAVGLLSGWIANAKVQRDRELAVINQLMTASAKSPYEVIRQQVVQGTNAPQFLVLT
jgi:hypothetical protein